MKKHAYILISSLLIGGAVTAQNEADALRYSQTQVSGSARFVSMGGAFGALGGDASALSYNPGGIGVFRKSEISFTPTFRHQNSETDHFGGLGTESESNLHFGNFNAVFSLNVNDPKWKSLNFGVGYVRQNSFASRLLADGHNRESSLLDVYTNNLNENNVSPENIDESGDPFGAELAWFLFLVDTAGTNYFNPIGSQGSNQRNLVTQAGSQSETVISLGGNYDDRLYIGGSVGITRINYERDYVLTETTLPGDNSTDLEEYTYTEGLSTFGTGYNFKLGFIYRMPNNLRIGGAFHSPTIYYMDDQWDTQMASDFQSVPDQIALSPFGNSEYRLQTPYRAIGSLAYVFGKSGLVSMDYEFINYRSAKLSSETGDYNYASENANIDEAYRATGNIRIGYEQRFNKMYGRLGFVNYGNPYASDFNNKQTNQTYSAGVGIRTAEYFIDLAYALNRRKEDYFLYDASIIPGTEQTLMNSTFSATLGLRF